MGGWLQGSMPKEKGGLITRGETQLGMGQVALTNGFQRCPPGAVGAAPGLARGVDGLLQGYLRGKRRAS